MWQRHGKNAWAVVHSHVLAMVMLSESEEVFGMKTDVPIKSKQVLVLQHHAC